DRPCSPRGRPRLRPVRCCPVVPPRCVGAAGDGGRHPPPRLGRPTPGGCRGPPGGAAGDRAGASGVHRAHRVAETPGRRDHQRLVRPVLERPELALPRGRSV
ncbi:MAG: hypothetical protein AVDCRST_MAG68-5159, partial [uncultured Gemmatimonadetes bacterium]